MLFPDKLSTFEESVISKFTLVLDIIKEKPVAVIDLYNVVNKKMTGMVEFIEVLDCLYALGKIEFDQEGILLTYVG